MQENPVVWFEIYVEDMPRAVAFYQGVLDIKMEKMPSPHEENGQGMEMWSFAADNEQALSQYGAMGALVKMEGVRLAAAVRVRWCISPVKIVRSNSPELSTMAAPCCRKKCQLANTVTSSWLTILRAI